MAQVLKKKTAPKLADRMKIDGHYYIHIRTAKGASAQIFADKLNNRKSFQAYINTDRNGRAASVEFWLED
jgi:hypothetical protein